MARCVWCEKRVKPRKLVRREVTLSRGETYKRHNFHKKCWPEFMILAFMRTEPGSD